MRTHIRQLTIFGMTLDDAIAHFGSRRALAEALGISQPAIAQWGDEIPELRQYQIREIILRNQKPPQERAAS